MSYPDLTKYEIDDTWAGSEGTIDGMPYILRIRQNLRPLAGHPDLTTRLRILWEFECQGDSGLPTEWEMEQMSQFEDVLVDSFEPDNLAVLTKVMTCDGIRQWIFYASDIEACGRRLNNALPHDPPLPIELLADSDESWLDYTETLSELGL